MARVEPIMSLDAAGGGEVSIAVLMGRHRNQFEGGRESIVMITSVQVIILTGVI